MIERKEKRKTFRSKGCYQQSVTVIHLGPILLSVSKHDLEKQLKRNEK